MSTHETKIGWTHRPGTKGRTWNPSKGCSRISKGCMRCYAERQAVRMSGPGKPYEELVQITSHGPQWTGRVMLDENRLLDPLRWRQPSTIFVDSMSDLFHESLSFEQIDSVFAVMAAADWHTFQILTKRASRMRDYLSDPETPVRIQERIHSSTDTQLQWPIRNCWMGVSAENQDAADERITHLIGAPAALRFVSYEPALGPLDLTAWLASISTVLP